MNSLERSGPDLLVRKTGDARVLGDLTSMNMTAQGGKAATKHARSEAPENGIEHGQRALVIGVSPSALPDGLRDVAVAELDEIDQALLDAVRPAVVLSHLITDRFDAMEVALRLAAVGWQGRYRALAPALPNLDLVRREVAAAAPALDFDIVVTDQTEAG